MNLKRQFQSHPPIIDGKFLERNRAVKALQTGNKFIDEEQLQQTEANFYFHIGLGCFFVAGLVIIFVGFYLAWKI